MSAQRRRMGSVALVIAAWEGVRRPLLRLWDLIVRRVARISPAGGAYIAVGGTAALALALWFTAAKPDAPDTPWGAGSTSAGPTARGSVVPEVDVARQAGDPGSVGASLVDASFADLTDHGRIKLHQADSGAISTGAPGTPANLWCATPSRDVRECRADNREKGAMFDTLVQAVWGEPGDCVISAGPAEFVDVKSIDWIPLGFGAGSADHFVRVPVAVENHGDGLLQLNLTIVGAGSAATPLELPDGAYPRPTSNPETSAALWADGHDAPRCDTYGGQHCSGSDMAYSFFLPPRSEIQIFAFAYYGRDIFPEEALLLQPGFTFGGDPSRGVGGPRPDIFVQLPR